MDKVSSDNFYAGIVMVWLSGFFVSLNLYDMLPHVGGVDGSIGKIIIAIAVGLCGMMWSNQGERIE